MKFQHLILPLVLWLLSGLIITYVSPTSPLIVAGIIVLISLAVYLSLRVIFRNKLPLIIMCCVILILVSNSISGFSFINMLLIGAIGTLVSVLFK